MVLPAGEFAPGEGVVVARTRAGRLIGFRDPETGRFISRVTALGRVTYDPQTGKILDSFKNPVGVGAFRLPGEGAMRETENTVQTWKGLDVDARQFRPAANQELVERITVINRDGRLSSFEISHKFGGRYDPKAPGRGGKFRFELSKALGLREDERLPTEDLRAAIAYKEIIIRTTTRK